MAVTQIDGKQFPREVVSAAGIVFVDFYAPWCGPCKMTAPVIDQLAEMYPNVKFFKVNVDENGDLATQYSIFSIPTFVMFKNGQIVAQFAGAMGKEGFQSEINKVIG